MAKHVATADLGFNPNSYEQNTAKSVKNAYAQTAGAHATRDRGDELWNPAKWGAAPGEMCV